MRGFHPRQPDPIRQHGRAAEAFSRFDAAEWASGSLVGKPAAFFTSTATMHGGQETTLLSMMCRCCITARSSSACRTPKPRSTRPSAAARRTARAMSSGTDGERAITEHERDLARALGRRLATDRGETRMSRCASDFIALIALALLEVVWHAWLASRQCHRRHASRHRVAGGVLRVAVQSQLAPRRAGRRHGVSVVFRARRRHPRTANPMRAGRRHRNRPRAHRDRRARLGRTRLSAQQTVRRIDCLSRCERSCSFRGIQGSTRWPFCKPRRS